MWSPICKARTRVLTPVPALPDPLLRTILILGPPVALLALRLLFTDVALKYYSHY